MLDLWIYTGFTQFEEVIFLTNNYDRKIEPCMQ